MKKLIIISIFIFQTGCFFSQNQQVVNKNNELIISYFEYDSIYSIFKVERYHDESHHFGKLTIKGDSAFFSEDVDTFFLIQPKVFYEFDEKIPKGHIKLESRISFWEAPEWKSWLYDLNYIIDDSLTFVCDKVFEDFNEFHTLLIPLQPEKFDLVVSTTDLLISKSLQIDLRSKEFYRNFKLLDSKKTLYNRVIIKFKVVGTMPLPGLNFKDYAPNTITIDGKEYKFKVTNK